MTHLIWFLRRFSKSLQPVAFIRIVFRDLKPRNLLLSAEGYVKLADFSFAKVLPSGAVASFGRLSKDMKGHRFPVFPEAGRTRPAAHQTTSRLSSLNATDTLMLWTGGLWASSPTSVCQAESTKVLRASERERESRSFSTFRGGECKQQAMCQLSCVTGHPPFQSATRTQIYAKACRCHDATVVAPRKSWKVALDVG